MSISNFAENAILDALFNNVALQKSTRFLKLHTADPGEAGLTAAAAETTRKTIAGAAAAAGVFTSTGDLTWTKVAATETYAYVSVWDDLTAGNCLWVGALAAPKAVVAGDTFTIAAGALTVSLD